MSHWTIYFLLSGMTRIRHGLISHEIVYFIVGLLVRDWTEG